MSLILKRQNTANKDTLHYFWSSGCFTSRISILGELSIGETEAPLQIQRKQGCAYSSNVSDGNGLTLQNGETIPLSAGQHIVLTAATMSVTSLS